MTLHVGRIRGLTLGSWRQSGNVVRIEGHILEPREELEAKIFQLNTLPGLLVPVIDTLQPDRTGLYQVEGASANLATPTRWRLRGRFTLQLARVASSPATVEVRWEGTERDDSESNVTGRPLVAWPAGVAFQTIEPDVTAATITRNHEDSTTIKASWSDSAVLASDVAVMVVEANEWYDGGCKIEWRDATGPWHVLNHTELPPNLAPADIRMDNGIIRWYGDGQVDVYDGGWYTMLGLSPLGVNEDSDASFFIHGTTSVLVNSGHRVALSHRGYNSEGETIDLEVGITRGQAFIDGRYTSNVATSVTLMASSNTGAGGSFSPVAATSLTGGIHQTSNDAEGNRWVFMSPGDLTKDTTNGWLDIDGTSGTFGIGVNIGGTGAGASSGNRVADVVEQYWGATSITERLLR